MIRGTCTVSLFLRLLQLLRRGEGGGVEGVAGDELELELDELVEELELEEDLGFDSDRAAFRRPRPRPLEEYLGCGSRGSRGVLLIPEVLILSPSATGWSCAGCRAGGRSKV